MKDYMNMRLYIFQTIGQQQLTTGVCSGVNKRKKTNNKVALERKTKRKKKEKEKTRSYQ